EPTASPRNLYLLPGLTPLYLYDVELQMVVGLKGLTSNAKQSSIDELNSCLADAISRSRAIKQAHWNIKGKNFIAVHELFDQVNARVSAQIDEIAERVQILDGVALGTLEEAAKNTSLAPYPTDL